MSISLEYLGRFQIFLCLYLCLSLSQRYKIHKVIKYTHLKGRAKLPFMHVSRYHYPGQGVVLFQHTKRHPRVLSMP